MQVRVKDETRRSLSLDVVRVHTSRPSFGLEVVSSVCCRRKRPCWRFVDLPFALNNIDSSSFITAEQQNEVKTGKHSLYHKGYTPAIAIIVVSPTYTFKMYIHSAHTTIEVDASSLNRQLLSVVPRIELDLPYPIGQITHRRSEA